MATGAWIYYNTHVLNTYLTRKEAQRLAADYEKMFRILKSLPGDIFLGAHGGYFDLEAKYGRLQRGDHTAFVDPGGYRKFVAQKEQEFRTELAKQKAQ